MSEAVAYKKRQYNTTLLYYGAQRNDQWDGEAYDGTSGLGLCRHLKSTGIINEYRWCFSLEDYLLALSWEGPVGFGTWWKTGMWDTDPNGFIQASGSNEGGHEVTLSGINVSKEYVWVTNSWGRGWGVDGKAKLSFAGLETLINQDADGFVITS